MPLLTMDQGLFMIALALAGMAIFRQDRSIWRRPTPLAPPPTSPVPSDPTAHPRAILEAIREQTRWMQSPDPDAIKREAVAEAATVRDHAEVMRALDTIALKMDEFVRVHRHMLEIMFGTGSANGAGVPAGSPGGRVNEDEDPDLRRTTERFMETYGLSWEEALKRAKAYRMYRPNDSPMRAEA